MIPIFTSVVNRPDFIEIQKKLFDKFLDDEYQTRDFVHVSDVVLSNILVSQKELKSYREVYNVGTGEGAEIKKIANLVSSYQISVPERPGEILHSRSSVDKIKNDLGWNPSINVLDWIKNND